jgi:hypothetical protein
VVVGYLVHVGNQKQVGIEVVVKGDAHMPQVPAGGKIAHLRLPVFGKLKVKRRILPEGQAIGPCRFRNMCLQYTLYLLYRHGFALCPQLQRSLSPRGKNKEGSR